MGSNGEKMVAEVAPSYSTGGGGFTFERRAAVRYLAAMLSGASRQELGDRRVVRVSFQQSSVSPLDDVHVLAKRVGEDKPSLELWVAARRRPKFQRRDPKSQQLVKSLVEAAALAEVPGRDRRLVVCVAGFENRAPAQVAQLSDLARGGLSEESFDSARESAPRPVRNRFSHLRDLVRGALAEGSEISVWQLLRRLHVVSARLEPPDEEDWAALLGELEGWSRDQTLTGAEALRSHFVHLADQYDPAAAEVDRSRLCREAHSLLHDSRRLLTAAWEELRRLQQEARGHVRSHCGNDPPVALRRDAARKDLIEALTSTPVLSVSGKSGAGKSALVCSALDDLRDTSSDGSFEALYLNLRLLPPSGAALRAAIGAPLDDVFTEMTAPARLVVIDAADRAAVTDDTPLAEIVRCAVAAGVAVCVVSATEASDTVEGLVADSAGQSPQRYNVPALDDDEIGELARALPVLSGMAADNRGRELLQLPVYADLLARSGVSNTSFSHSAAMDVIWHRRIRGELSRGRGNPDARDQAMRQLALQELNPSDPDQLYASLDAAALDGLRRDDILRDSQQSSPLPVFAHDILRDFAVAKVLASTGDPVERLESFNTPRAAIPAGRLALESQIQNSSDRVAMLDQLQAACDGMVASGASDRWGDLPMEVALRIPESGELLADAWEGLTSGEATGLRRALRLVAQRHTIAGIAEVGVAAPLASLLVERGWPASLQDAVESFLEAWLFGLGTRAAPSGNQTRVGLRSLLEHKVAAGEDRERQRSEDLEASRAARIPAETATDRERAGLLGSVAGTRSRRRGHEQRLPLELREESTLRFLALLGPDLGSCGEALLRRVAEHDPASLIAAVEAPGAGTSLAQYNRSLLIDLVDAYYIDNHANALDDPLDRHGIRQHRFHGLGNPMAAPWYGPFMAMFRHSFVEGVACLNRLLDHAARFQAQRLSRSRWGEPDDGTAEDQGVELSLLGSPGRYAGRIDTWLWYRVVYSGPPPCTSALQALEIVCDQLIEAGSMTSDELIRTLLTGCGNLAMPGLAYGIMVRHLERFQRSLDAFLVEPFVRQAEIRRVVREGSFLASNVSTVVAPERRKWTPLETVMWLALHADEDRAQELRSLGATYFRNATTGPAGASEDPERLAVARKHALAFDRDQYEVTRSGDQVIVQQRIDPQVESALADSNRESRRSMEAERLENRYAERTDQIIQPAPLEAEELLNDIATAQNLMADPPHGPLDSEAAPACVAAATLEGRFLDGIAMSAADVVWAAATLAKIVRERRDRFSAYDTDTPTVFWWGADRGAGRGLPLLLRADARTTRSQLEAQGLDEDELHRTVLWLFTHAPTETRYAAGRALDSVWQSPCVDSDSCHHRAALRCVEESLRWTRRRRWRPDNEPDDTPLIGPLVEALTAVEPQLLVLSALNPSLRALGAEAGAATCVHDNASEMLDAALKTHRRARQAFGHGDHAQWDALFAARAVLQQAAAGNTSAIQEHIAAFRHHFYGLWECLLALAAAAEESPQTAAAAAEAWPAVIRDGLRFVEEAASEDSTRDDMGVLDQVFAALLPSQAPDNMYAYREMTGKPVAWITPAAWEPEIDQWVNVAVASHENAATSNRTLHYSPSLVLPASGVFGTIDALVSMLHAPAIEERARIGIHWVERLVVAAGESATKTFSLPEWLQDVRRHCGPREQEAWERIVDLLFFHGDPRVQDLAD